MLVQADAAALEWRCLLDLSGDQTGIGEVLNGLDTHSANQQAFDLPSRLIAKKYLFRTIFRGSGYAFAHDHEFKHVSSDPDYWDDINAKFFRKYAGIDRCHQTWAEAVLSGQPIVGPTGRFWTIGMGTDKRGNPKLPWTTLTNYPVQGTSADIMALCRVAFFSRLKKTSLRSKYISTVHDSLVVDCPEEEVDIVAEMLYNVFSDLPKNFIKIYNYKPKLPYACEVKIGLNLTEMSKYEPAKH